ncbi:MAG: bifunctional DNA-formamidopyrimidine glycosylase/DNA-(apurinic or apyrimidinic site) lyase [Aquiluna sp.]
MPELPEVETVRAGLANHVLDALVTDVHIHDLRSLKRNFSGPDGFSKELTGKRLQGIVRRGKFLWFPISLDRAVVCHLGMSGQVLVRSKDFGQDKLTRITIGLEKPSGEEIEMRFVDQRLFGGMQIDDMVETSDQKPAGYFPEGPSTAMIPTSVSHIARDLLDPEFDGSGVVSKMRGRNSGIKRVLLDQNLLSGIGNIYADESLWRARLHYDRPASAISVRRLNELISTAKDVLQEAVLRGGTSFDEQYKNVNGESGYFSQDLNAYSRAGLPCARCATPIKRAAWANRSSFFCPKCQRKYSFSAQPREHRD